MSDPETINEPPIRARDIEGRAAVWLAVQERAELTSDDRQRFDAWMAKSLAHRVAYWRLNAAWTRAKRLAALRPPMHKKKSLATDRWPWRIAVRWSAGIATVALLSLSAVFLTAKPVAQTFVTGIGGHKILKLADGSQIELNTNTSVRVSVSSQSRTVWLDKGEAYFLIKHDTDHAFTVISGDRSVTDLGTEFSIRREQNQLEVAVMQGRVLFETVKRIKTPTLLTEGDTAVVIGNSLSITKNSMRKLANESAWRHGMLVFDQISLADAAAEFNRYNRKKLVIRDARAGQRTIGATFPIHDIDQFIDVTQEVLKLHVKNHGDEILISR